LPEAIDFESVREWAAEENIKLVQTSAKTGQNIEALFTQIAELVSELQTTEPDRIQITEAQVQDDRCC
jgi:selenocysteine-specific translation elongation factor